MTWRTTALVLALSFFATGVFAQQDPMKEQLRKQQEALKQAQEQQKGGQPKSSSGPAACAGGWWKTTGLKATEMAPSVGGGSGFDAACRAHDKCYKTCGGPAQSACDADLKRDTAKVCSNQGTPAEKKSCATQQDSMSAIIAKMGPGAFKQARDKCPARR